VWRSRLGILIAVSGDNIDLARRAVEAFAARDIETFGAYCDPQIEIQPAITVLERTVFRGASAYRQFVETIDEAWESGEGTLERVTEIDDDRVMAVLRFRARSRGSGVPVDQVLVWIMTFHEDTLTRIDAYSSLGAALEAAGQPRD
jgi:ketosteroid isomerase-like protein